jgi:hypothetical protein
MAVVVQRQKEAVLLGVGRLRAGEAILRLGDVILSCEEAYLRRVRRSKDRVMRYWSGDRGLEAGEAILRKWEAILVQNEAALRRVRRPKVRVMRYWTWAGGLRLVRRTVEGGVDLGAGRSGPEAGEVVQGYGDAVLDRGEAALE